MVFGFTAEESHDHAHRKTVKAYLESVSSPEHSIGEGVIGESPRLRCSYTSVMKGSITFNSNAMIFAGILDSFLCVSCCLDFI